MFIYTLW